ncbi:hypothetical protein [Duganella sp. HH105]|uniref:hypothetical protein n=1 Tax=Duganella sp. HH105 TaxID=1781067 RepID=UPI00087414EF|nr:hypothetical protein [Duganella sp. HH105]
MLRPVPTRFLLQERRPELERLAWRQLPSSVQQPFSGQLFSQLAWQQERRLPLLVQPKQRLERRPV